MEQSIFTSTKKNLGIDSTYTVFDLDILTHINSAFFNLTQIGIGPSAGFFIEDDSAEWADFITDEDELAKLQSIKTYIYLKVRQWFDPPETSYAITAFEKQIEQLEWRLNVSREETEWVDPDPPIPEVV